MAHEDGNSQGSQPGALPGRSDCMKDWVGHSAPRKCFMTAEPMSEKRHVPGMDGCVSADGM